ncbi:PDS5 [Lepeophtheirus salmonis]|uniref:PDS5 n=1 Tax=Lepeophtheirus salmonis TaxID=72036 RepID=A0A7R8H2Y9_LEPSM|nr:PDS5 [Lepeophtheirus salmonis]CAF2821057.1 PDS5 [Lepeophtheirus salmonis]
MILQKVIMDSSGQLGSGSVLGSTFLVLAYTDDTALLADSLPQLEFAFNKTFCSFESLSQRKKRLHSGKKMGKFTVAKNLHLAHKGCLTGRFLMETEMNLPDSILLMALPVQSRALEAEVWKAVVNKKGGLSICRTCG